VGIYCPRTVYRDAWLNRNLSLEAFERLSLAFSLAGVDEKNDALRRGTSLDTILRTIHILHEVKKNLGKELPAIHIAYMLLRSRLEDIERLPHFLQGLAVNQVVVSTLDFVACKELEGETIIPSTAKEYEELRTRLDAVKVETEQFGVECHYRLQRPGECSTTCTENIQRSLFVSSDGMVSPCVFTNLPISQETQICFNGDRRYRHLIFGNVGDAPIGDIWQGRAYRDFRKSFYGKQLQSICKECPKLFMG